MNLIESRAMGSFPTAVANLRALATRIEQAHAMIQQLRAAENTSVEQIHQAMEPFIRDVGLGLLVGKADRDSFGGSLEDAVMGRPVAMSLTGEVGAGR